MGGATSASRGIDGSAFDKVREERFTYSAGALLSLRQFLINESSELPTEVPLCSIDAEVIRYLCGQMSTIVECNDHIPSPSLYNSGVADDSHL